MSDVLEKIEYIETHYDVNAIEYDGIKLWPFLRSGYYFTYYNKLNNFSCTKEVKRKNRYISLLKDLFKAVRYTNIVLFFKKNPVLLYTDTLEIKELSNGPIDKIANLIIQNEKNILPVVIYADNNKKYVLRKKVDFHFIDFICKMKRCQISEYDISGFETLKQIMIKLDISFDNIGAITLIKRYIAFYRKWFNKVRPKRIYVNCYYNLHKMSMIYVAKELNIKVIELQHGVIGPEHCGYKALIDISPNPYPDYLFSFGKKFKQFISPAIYKENQIKYVGSFIVDNIKNNRVESKTKFKNKYGDLSGRIIITVASQNTIDKELLLFYSNIAKYNKKYFIVFVPRVFEAYHHEYELDNLVIETELSIYECMVSSDIASTVYSTCALESLALGIPTLLVNFENKAKNLIGMFFNVDSTVRYCDNEDMFNDCIDKLLAIDKKLICEEGNTFFEVHHDNLILKALSEI